MAYILLFWAFLWLHFGIRAALVIHSAALVSPRVYLRTFRLYLNRIMFDSDEICATDAGEELVVRLNEDDYRAEHILTVLKSTKGDVFKGGVVDIGMTNEAKIVDIDHSSRADTQVDTSQRARVIAKAAAKAKASVKSVFRGTDDADTPFMTLSLGRKSLLTTVEVPPVDLILACPRPLRFERLIPVVSSMGVGSLVVVGGEKVEKGFFGSHLFRYPAAMRECLIEGLSQACNDYRVPTVTVDRALHKFLLDIERLDRLYPPREYRRVIAHPPTPSDLHSGSLDASALGSRRMMEIPRPSGSPAKVVVAVGPEGGWTDGELALFLKRGFHPVHLGERVLRTDVATPALLALAHEWVVASKSSPQ